MWTPMITLIALVLLTAAGAATGVALTTTDNQCASRALTLYAAPSHTGCTPTTTTEDTPHSQATHPSAASPTSPVRTPRAAWLAQAADLPTSR